ncbi:hypothetical protein SAMN05444000_10399 [Shimia gijangensis]|uniref:Integrase DNA-binding domain-containing protein n=1 Tax=Shimia gijangensis TaxID=1470563 RepID=A0A1M6E3U5_9RHOB|nr:hypothetical protein SAMN05444000_10399 [Shimia gijangensis]
MTLTNLTCKTANPGETRRKLFDGSGMYLLVRLGGTKNLADVT